MIAELNLNFEYSVDEDEYDVVDADTEDFLFCEPTLQGAYDRAKEKCELWCVEMGFWLLLNCDPSEWDEINR